MGARSTYPIREAFSLDENTKVTTVAKDMGLDLGTIKTIRVVVLDATVVQAAGAGTDATIEFQDADAADEVFYTITSSDLADLDANGVYIDHVRGALWEGRRNIKMAYTAGVAGGGTAGAISGFSVYLDAVEVNY
ncbi:MAG: hypothetical protein ACO24H_02410 [Polynucleobacter sp.]